MKACCAGQGRHSGARLEMVVASVQQQQHLWYALPQLAGCNSAAFRPCRAAAICASKYGSYPSITHVERCVVLLMHRTGAHSMMHFLNTVAYSVMHFLSDKTHHGSSILTYFPARMQAAMQGRGAGPPASSARAAGRLQNWLTSARLLLLPVGRTR